MIFEHYNSVTKGPTRKYEVVNSLTQILPVPERKNYLPLNDYRECAEMMLKLLGTTPARGAHWLKPGAAHHARWMPSLLYPAIDVCFEYAENRQIGSIMQTECTFLRQKVPRSSVDADAPFNDPQLWLTLNHYLKYDSAVADAAMAALKPHLWYLTEESAVFALFSNRVDDAERQQTACQLHKCHDQCTSKEVSRHFPY